ncbi:hypothetical protein DY000_02027959 [Brassica cretica]|uniref:Uncharacterized protein n=1 Tax=Brassica cretica TaxID=69181 RepID=A0ABQ7E551_BRACR|nr:hypothetical protein DY000_02027959 [Brassica cretica]
MMKRERLIRETREDGGDAVRSERRRRNAVRSETRRIGGGDGQDERRRRRCREEREKTEERREKRKSRRTFWGNSIGRGFQSFICHGEEEKTRAKTEDWWWRIFGGFNRFRSSLTRDGEHEERKER